MLTLSHGQMSIERGFSLKSTILKTNVGPRTVITKRLIIDHMIANNLRPHTIEISKPMLKACRSAHSSYKIR